MFYHILYLATYLLGRAPHVFVAELGFLFSCSDLWELLKFELLAPLQPFLFFQTIAQGRGYRTGPLSLL